MIKNIKKPMLYLTIFFVLLGIAKASNDTMYLKLDDAINMALQNNKSVLIAKEKLNEKSASLKAAFGSFLPQINLSATYTRLANAQNLLLPFPMSFGNTQYPVYDMSGNIIGYTDSIPVMGVLFETIPMSQHNNYDLRASATQTLFTWGKLINAYKIGGLTYDIEKENYRKAKEDLKTQVTQAFYQTMLADRGVSLMHESYAQMQKHIDQIDKLYKSGMVTNLDLLRAKVQLANIRSQVIRIENARNIAYTALKSVLSIDDETPVLLNDTFAFLPANVSLDSAINTALSERAEIKNMRRTVSIANRALWIQKTSNLPNVFTAFNYDYKKPVGLGSTDWGQDWNLTLGASMPFFTGGANLFKTKQIKAQLKQTKLGLAMIEDGITLDVKNTYFNLEQEKQILSYQGENVGTAEQALNLAEQRYNNGQITNLEYMDIQLAFTQAKFDQMTSISNCIIAQVKLMNAVGK
jgi:outer membrane protein TolC